MIFIGSPLNKTHFFLLLRIKFPSAKKVIFNSYFRLILVSSSAPLLHSTLPLYSPTLFSHSSPTKMSNTKVRSHKLRRCLAICDLSVDGQMCLREFDYNCSSNKDILLATHGLTTGVFRHPRARQMAAAARYGWKFTPDQSSCPEDWMNDIRIAHSYNRRYVSPLTSSPIDAPPVILPVYNFFSTSL